MPRAAASRFCVFTRILNLPQGIFIPTAGNIHTNWLVKLPTTVGTEISQPSGSCMPAGIFAHSIMLSSVPDELTSTNPLAGLVRRRRGRGGGGGGRGRAETAAYTATDGAASQGAEQRGAAPRRRPA